MKEIKNLRDLFLEEGREVYDANRQGLKMFKDIEAKASTDRLKNLIRKEAQQTESQQQNILEAFKRLNENCEGGKCATTQSILNRTQQFINKSNTKETRDASIISSLQQLTHMRMADLGSTAAHAREIGHEETARMFHDALEQEKKFDKELSNLAQGGINKQATYPVMN
jgi:ferritin-like metal-binding protein YciE